jgi:hypothetical protein
VKGTDICFQLRHVTLNPQSRGSANHCVRYKLRFDVPVGTCKPVGVGDAASHFPNCGWLGISVSGFFVCLLSLTIQLHSPQPDLRIYQYYCNNYPKAHCIRDFGPLHMFRLLCCLLTRESPGRLALGHLALCSCLIDRNQSHRSGSQFHIFHRRCNSHPICLRKFDCRSECHRFRRYYILYHRGRDPRNRYRAHSLL